MDKDFLYNRILQNDFTRIFNTSVISNHETTNPGHTLSHIHQDGINLTSVTFRPTASAMQYLDTIDIQSDFADTINVMKTHKDKLTHLLIGMGVNAHKFNIAVNEMPQRDGFEDTISHLVHAARILMPVVGMEHCNVEVRIVPKLDRDKAYHTDTGIKYRGHLTLVGDHGFSWLSKSAEILKIHGNSPYVVGRDFGAFANVIGKDKLSLFTSSFVHGSVDDGIFTDDHQKQVTVEADNRMIATLDFE